MTRKAQTLSIIGAIFAAVAIYIGYDTVTNPNLDGLTEPQKCEYWAYWHNHGGSVEDCKLAAAMAAAARMTASDPDLLTPDEMNAVDRDPDPDVQPTKVK